jgi:hypothetical protein
MLTNQLLSSSVYLFIFQGKQLWDGHLLYSCSVSAFFSHSLYIKPTSSTQINGTLTLFYGMNCCWMLELKQVHLRCLNEIVLILLPTPKSPN